MELLWFVLVPTLLTVGQNVHTEMQQAEQLVKPSVSDMLHDAHRSAYICFWIGICLCINICVVG